MWLQNRLQELRFIGNRQKNREDKEVLGSFAHPTPFSSFLTLAILREPELKKPPQGLVE
jgi:hypothetical protein